eukprot:9562844-Alexandrium_andersonii.AAC.1
MRRPRLPLRLAPAESFRPCPCSPRSRKVPRRCLRVKVVMPLPRVVVRGSVQLHRSPSDGSGIPRNS